MPIPDFLETQIREGKVVLLLGAGASLAAKDAAGNGPPTGSQLSVILADKFLGGKHRGLPLSQVAELSISETDLSTVQECIREIFERFEPSPAHRLLSSFFWWGIATTNYDRLIERAYETSHSALQVPCPFIENGDRVEDRLRDQRNVMLLKLHGCITRTSNPDCPLILTTDQYISHRKGRDRIFDHLKGWAFERTVVFLGHSLQDSDLRAILLELTSIGDKRPRYYAVAPDVDDVQARFWESKKITSLAYTFEEFMQALDNAVAKHTRGFPLLADRSSTPISSRFVVRDAAISRACAQFLSTDVVYVNAVTATEAISPAKFYRGVNPGFCATEQSLDAPRHLTDTILTDVFLSDEGEHPPGLELVLLKAHAGAGKTVVMRRMAWDAAHDYNKICLYLQPHGVINSSAIQEVINLCQERIFLFVDDAADRVRELQSLAASIGPEGRLLTIVVAERINEWNIMCEPIAPLVTDWYELKYLSSKEIDALLELLETHKALGTLERLDAQDRRRAFADRAGRQLLVALHEATLGKPFEDIIEDEFKHVEPYEAQRIYLTICVLNRLNVPVRAGIVARIHGVPFEEFRKRLFSPLELVVQTEYDPIIRDYLYRARHPHIAEIVFERILANQEERYDAYLRCLQELNIDYSTDLRAFRQMIRGRSLLELFPNHELVKRIYHIARNHVGDDAFLLHQMAIYEMHRPNGNPHECSELLNRANALAPHDGTIKHSMAEHRLRAAEQARTPLEREKLLSEATQIAASLRSSRLSEPYAYHTLVKIGLKRLEDAINQSQDDGYVRKIVKDIEDQLFDGLQRFPGDSYLLEADSRFAALLSDSKRVLESLGKAFVSNPRNGFLAIRLADCYVKCGEFIKAQNVLHDALEANRGERRLHYAYAKLLALLDDASGEELGYHLQRSFSPGDSNYDAQIRYGRQLFVNGDLEGCRFAFGPLRNARVAPEVRDRLLYPIHQTFHGSIARMEATYCFIARDGRGDWIYGHRNDTKAEVWRDLGLQSRVVFRIAFSLRGPNAFATELESQSGAFGT